MPFSAVRKMAHAALHTPPAVVVGWMVVLMGRDGPRFPGPPALRAVAGFVQSAKTGTHVVIASGISRPIVAAEPAPSFQFSRLFEWTHRFYGGQRVRMPGAG